MMENNTKPRQMGVLVGREGKQKDFSEHAVNTSM